MTLFLTTRCIEMRTCVPTLPLYVGCIREQLGSLMQGFTSLVPSSELESFSAHELEVVLSGQPTIDLQFLRSRTKFTGYSASSNVVQWLWQVLAEFTQVWNKLHTMLDFFKGTVAQIYNFSSLPFGDSVYT